ncbi:hypothetical protein BAUCODRAFT_578727 [Baudoinia panamericana UAMH 10762]|uniref:Beta-lactamase-related domain-containing protein n=1 Tax=Baudoinia panamericana (strain UAMH 10762) TaxID=717646 RepID=M2LKE8_BAUPA|nr:uncharacterized protein BAUCODRAFT_578727 [Baudoinia panamericana UAMH 10762]EMC94747.1 hypothetical protein BAUCODRAFT_578727 [Baudoinia panamericana UAMH 10762]
MLPPFTQRFDDQVEQDLARWHVRGASFAVVNGDEVHTKGYGFARLDPQKVVGPDTLFYAVSTTKAHLCAAWAFYINQMQTSRSSKPEFLGTRHSRISSRVTLEDAVSPRTGVSPQDTSYGYNGTSTTWGVTRKRRHSPLHTPLRSHFGYSNTPFILASCALEAVVAVEPLAQCLGEVLWDPLGMTQTYGGYYEAAKALSDRGQALAKSYTWSQLLLDGSAETSHLVEEPHQENEEVAGAGYIISTVLARSFYYWTSYTTVVDEVWRPRSIAPAGGDDYLPFDLYGCTDLAGTCPPTWDDTKVYWHTGGVTDAGSYILLCPTIRFGVAYFANGQDTSSKIRGLAMELLDIALCIQQTLAEQYYTALERLYPGAPGKPTVPLALPVAAYAGAYHNVGYGTLMITATKHNDEGGALEAKLSERSWKVAMCLTRVNGEHWLGTRPYMNSPRKIAIKARSEIGADGKIESFHMVMEPG